MALKDWKITLKTKDIIQYKKGKYLLTLMKHRQENNRRKRFWSIRTAFGNYINGSSKVILDNKTKSKALAYAKAYMKKH